jgi:phosphoglycolate phosphatase-like HAD superfamily hydrolase
MIRAIIFDFDGVLVESVDIKTRAFAEMYKKHGREIVNKVVEYHLKNGGVSRFEKFRYYQEVLLGRKLTKQEEVELGKRFSSLVEDMVVQAPWVPGAEAFLDMYYNQLDFHVASGTPDDELLRIIRAREMSHYFLSMNGSNRNKGEIICDIMDKYGYQSYSVLMVGDAMSDYKGAIEAEVGFVGRVPGGQKSLFPPDTLMFDNPFDYLHSLFPSVNNNS